MIETIFVILVWMIIFPILFLVIISKIIKILLNMFKNIKYSIKEKNKLNNLNNPQKHITETYKQKITNPEYQIKEEKNRLNIFNKLEKLTIEEYLQAILRQEIQTQEKLNPLETKKINSQEVQKILEELNSQETQILDTLLLKQRLRLEIQNEFLKRLGKENEVSTKSTEEIKAEVLIRQEAKIKQEIQLELKKLRREAQIKLNPQLRQKEIQRAIESNQNFKIRQKQVKIQKQEGIEKQEKLEREMQMSYVDSLENGYKFEEYIAELLEKLGYTNVEVTPSSGDGGADVLAKKNGVIYAFQCKWHSKNNIGKNIGYDAIQQAHSGKDLYKNERQLEEVYGIVATNSYFTNKAIDRAKILDITLWDRNKLEKLLKKARESSILY